MVAAALLAALLASAVAVPSAAAAAVPAGDPATPVIVRYRDAHLAAAAAEEHEGAAPAGLGPATVLLDVTAEERARLSADPAVLAVQDDLPYRAAVLPNDPAVPQQDYLRLVDAPGAWDRSRGSSSVVVAVLDTQVDLAHPDLAGKLVVPPGGGDFTVDPVTGQSRCTDAVAPPPSLDARDHGTMVAGLVGAATDNALAVAGLGWNTRVMPMRVLCRNGQGSTSTVAPAVRQAADAGASIINLSISQPVGRTFDGRCVAPGADATLAEAVAYAQARGVLVVAAAGNDGCADVPVAPASIAGVVAVAASTASDTLAGFSNTGTWVDVAAPGEFIYSLKFADYANAAIKSGTSFAAPLVSASLALVVAANPGITAPQAVERLRCGADRIVGTGSAVAWGRLNAARALGAPQTGYWVFDAAGATVTAGHACAPALSGGSLSGTVVAAAATASGNGYWLAGGDGSVAAYGDAVFRGSMAGTDLQAPIVGMAPTRSGQGYWLVAADGGIFAFGDAVFHGSMGGRFLSRPIVGMAPSRGGAGYWLVAADGGIFAFGDAPFLGSMGGRYLFRPMVGVAPSPSGRGYWMVADDGGVFAFGDAPFVGSIGGTRLNQPVTSLSPTRSGQGYWFVATDGGVFAFGDATFQGSGVGAFTRPAVALAGR